MSTTFIAGFFSLWLLKAPPAFEDQMAEKLSALANSYFRLGAACALMAQQKSEFRDGPVYSDDPRVFAALESLYGSRLGLDTNRWSLWPNIRPLTVLRD